ncbi:methyltransferase domain-containing protein [Aquibacillus koreensis]|uniref:Methyltransferase domain-containing protein n=1 Tax=Aquibacillus koreensis TaxID=279446 RepID=A0A9X3WMB1_9BACI|nr:class I SAM-dependent methyltransferase [Aquibacillus koreensis]MCT2537133.1 methyltransferase domain-containing protein [Aquibacillus koreensis]MDC3419884.1 methyltransferase domain-containing protein [Aquibacillus koreensis]
MQVAEKYNVNLLGESSLLNDLTNIIEKESSFVINIFGEQGTGKTLLIHYLEQMGHVRCTVEQLESNEADSIIESVGDDKIILIDDVDHYTPKQQFRELMSETFRKFGHVKVIYTSNTKFFTEALPAITNFNIEIGNRTFTYDEFVSYIKNPHGGTQIVAGCEIPENIIKNMHLFATYCKNFTILSDVIESVTAMIKRNNNITPQEFVHILTKSDLFLKVKKDLVIDTKSVDDSDYLFIIRMKDKIEKLCDIILDCYPDERVLYEVLRNQFKNSTFIEDTFQLPIQYEDKVLNICLTYDPIELLVKLLGPRDIILKLNELNMGEASFTNSIEDKAKLILKSIGMNILNKPKGILFFHDRFQSNYKRIMDIESSNMSKEYLIGLGISCYQDLENVFYEMLNFYATYFNQSLSNFLQEYNTTYPNEKVHDKRITFGKYIGLFSFLNKICKQQDYQLKMFNLKKRDNHIIPTRLLTNIQELSSFRSFFTHFQKVSFEVPFKTYQKRVIKIHEYALSILQEFIDSRIFPEIIKIKEVRFDEFGRKQFVAADWKNAEIRFSLSSNVENIDIYSHYYMLRNEQSIAINPVLIPRYLEDNREMFDGAGYDKSSQTQLIQGSTLINKITPMKNARVLDIGCGNGKTTVELFRKEPSVSIDACDISQSMIDKAIENRQSEGIAQENIHFYCKDAIDLDENEQYDLVFSNAALHWIVDSEKMYTKIYNSLKNGGKLAVHQGGSECYAGLHEKVKKAIDELDFNMYYQNWTYPIFYPTKSQFHSLLGFIGFRDVRIDSVETDGSEYPNLVENFANAGMLPYLNHLPDENLKKKLKRTYFNLCEVEKVNQYTHRLYAFATKGD